MLDIRKDEKKGTAAAVNEQKRLITVFGTFDEGIYTFKEWKEKAKKLGCTLKAIRTYWNEAPIVEEGAVTDDTFGDFEEGFSGSRQELRNYLLHNKPDFYQRALVVQHRDKEVDLTSGAFTDYFIQLVLRNNGFEWTITEKPKKYIGKAAPQKIDFNI